MVPWRYSDVRTGKPAGLAWLALLLFGLSLPTPGQAQTPTHARWKASPTRISSLYSIVHGGGIFLALNVTGRILVSEDGLTWTERPLGAKDRLNQVIHAGGRFLGVGKSGIVMTSADGLAWTRQNPGTMADLHSVIHGNGKFLAVGDEGTILSSVDGETWTRRKVKHGGRLASAALGDPGYVIVGAGGTSLFSPDGSEWTFGTSPIAANKVIYADKQYLAVGEGGAIRYSLDGKTWREAVAPNVHSLHDVIRSPDRYLAVGDSGTVLESRDGRVWTRHAKVAVRHGSGPASMSSVAHGKGRYVAVGPDEALMVSPDGETWTPLTFHPGNSSSVAYGAGRYVSVGGVDRVSLSADGVLWTRWSSGIPGRCYMRSIHFENGQFLAVGEGGMILASPDGEKWETRLRDTLAYNLNAVAYGPWGYVAVGTGRPAVSNGEPYHPAGGLILTSRDGRSWTLDRNPAYDDLFSVAFGNGRYVAAGEDGRILTSPDGKAWTQRKSGSEQRLFSVAYGAGLFVIAGWGGTILTSPDGVKWTDRSVAVERFLRGIIFNGRQFVAVGTASTICTSPDGIQWNLGSTSLLHALPGGLAFGKAGHVVLESFGKAGYYTDSIVTVDPASALHAPPSLSVELDGRTRIRIGIPPALRAHRISVSVSDGSGRKLRESWVAGRDPEILYPLGELPPGTYRVEIENGAANGEGKFHLSPKADPASTIRHREKNVIGL